MSKEGWIGCDFDGTLVKYSGWNHGDVGEPVEAMCKIIRKYIEAGAEVRIVTARAAVPENLNVVEDWTEEHLGKRLQVTDRKDFAMTLLFDDRAVSVKRNEGRLMISKDDFLGMLR